ncbi:nucleotidyltransferase domain-containing protein [Candidatus Pacearchaeota archaeon]|nr:nucleotidyltransferase domain-containing protein [Candidatus Pacearchaeota archaeon]
METIVKQAREVGTSAGVLLPRKWLNKQVVVTLFNPSGEKILQDIIPCLFKHNLNEDIRGIYLFGSYARGDFDFNSDIDILILTEKTDKLINCNNYEILMVSEDSFSKNLPNNLNYLSLLKEIKIIFNKELIEKYRNKKYKFNVKKYLPEIERIAGINRDTVKTCQENNMNVPDGIVYSIVLRLRELYMIKCLVSGKNYYKKDFLKLIEEKIYSAYLRIKRNEKELNNLSPDELLKILELSEKWLKELKE